jgi:hypothetical protein
MRCKDIRDVILTDYLDDPGSCKQAQVVNEHLTQCASCKIFLARSQKILVDPFVGASTVKVPDHVWTKIKESCLSHPQTSLARRVHDKLDLFLRQVSSAWPQLALSAGVVCFVLFLTLFQGSFLNRQQMANRFLQEQWEYFLSSDEEMDRLEMIVDWDVFL